MCTDPMPLLQLLQLADSAVPIGSAAHSFGLETLVQDGLSVDELTLWFTGYLAEAGRLDAAAARTAHRSAFLADTEFIQQWINLNQKLSALKSGRESRNASTTLGRRFLSLAAALAAEDLRLRQASVAARQPGGVTHHCVAFGLVAARLGIAEETAAAVYLQQSIMGLVSACQRLMPLGQQQASGILWALKKPIVEAAQSANIDEAAPFLPTLDLAAMRHPYLSTRLFIS